jgi:hypothetical protein
MLMSGFRNIALTVIGFAFTAAGVFMMATASTPDERVIGGACTLFFGACGLVGAAELWPAPALRPDPDGLYRIWSSRVISGIFCFAGLCFAAVGALMAQQVLAGETSFKMIVGALGLPFGLLAMAVFARDLQRPRLLYVLGPDGAESLHRKKWRVRWADVAQLGIGQVRGTRWLMLAPANGLPPYAMLTSASRVRFDDLYAVVSDLWAAAGNGQGRA